MAVVGTWTYSGDPSDSDRDAVRFLCGDTDENDQKISDEEIAWLLVQQSSVYFAAASAARGISAAYSEAVKSKTVGPVTISYAERAKEYSELAARLEAQAKSGAVLAFQPYVGGISKADKLSREQETDWVKPSFAVGMDDYPGTDRTEDGRYSGDYG
jgi:hypothetical protein